MLLLWLWSWTVGGDVQSAPEPGVKRYKHKRKIIRVKRKSLPKTIESRRPVEDQVPPILLPPAGVLSSAVRAATPFLPPGAIQFREEVLLPLAKRLPIEQEDEEMIIMWAIG